MSIIHDALKKVQQGQASKADKTPIDPVTPSPSSDSIFHTPVPVDPSAHDNLPIETLAPVKNKARSMLALLCAFAFTVGSIFFCYKQLQNCFPQIDDFAVSLYNKLTHKKKDPSAPENLRPLASITVNKPKPAAVPVAPKLPEPSAPAASVKPPSVSNIPVAAAVLPVVPASSPAPVSFPVVTDTPKPYVPQTLNIHGVMSNGKRNVVLIDDQVYQEGDEVDGVKIIKISLDSITVDNNGVEQSIRVKN